MPTATPARLEVNRAWLAMAGPSAYGGSMPGEVTDELLPLVYEELRRLAAARFAHEPAGATLQPTALVHEAWLKLAGSRQQDWNSRGHFFGAAAEAMRRILIDRARKRNRERHGGGLHRVSLDAVEIATTTDDETLLLLNDALDNKCYELPQRPAGRTTVRTRTGLPQHRAAGLSAP